MSEKIPYEQVMGRMRMDIDYIAEGAYQKGLSRGYKDGYEAGRNDTNILEYQRGLGDAWEAAKKIAQQWEEDTDIKHRVVIDDSIRITLDSMTASEAIAQLREYEQQKPDVKVGDEVFVYGINGNVVVVEVDEDCIDISDLRGWHSWYDRKNLKKTGRHFPQVEELLKAMKGEQRDCPTCGNENPIYCDACLNGSQWEPKGEQRNCHTCKHQLVNSIKCVDCYGYEKWESKGGAE